MNQPSLFDRPAVCEVAKRDAALSQVEENAGPDWKSQVIALVASMPCGAELTGEDVRLACQVEGIEPHHHNAWGAMTGTLIREGLLVPTGEYRAMRAKGSHELVMKRLIELGEIWDLWRGE